MAFSNYLYNLDPDSYGGKQDDYLIWANRMLQETSQAINKEKDLRNLFFEITATLAAQRQEIAKKHETEHAYHFGHPRNNPKHPPSYGYAPTFTPLCGERYKKFNEISLKQLFQFVKAGEAKKDEVVNGIECRFALRTLKGDALKPYLCLPSRSDVTAALQKPEISKILDEEKIEIDSAGEYPFNFISYNYKAWESIKTYAHSLYKQTNHAIILNKMGKDYPSPDYFQADGKTHFFGHEANLKSQFPIGELKIKIDGTWVTLSKMFTWTYDDGLQTPAERMLVEPPVVHIVHQDPYDIDRTMKFCATLFEKAVLQEDETKLQDDVALFRFVYAHCMPHCRGDGAIGDIMELAIYHSHGYTHVKHSQETLPCFEPLASLSLSYYLSVYPTTLSLGEREAPTNL